MALSACGDDERRETRPRASSDAQALTLRANPTPEFRVPRYETRGTIPQVAGAPDLRRVNAALVAMVRRDQRAYAPQARRAVRRLPRDFPHRGDYGTDRVEQASASTEVVSVLVPLHAVSPGGNTGSTWLSTTVRVPSGERVDLLDLFADRREGLRLLARLTRRNVETDRSSQWRCARSSIRNPVVGDLMKRDLLPRRRNYRHYALTTDGLVLAFPQSQFAAPPCSSMWFVTPHATIDPHLSKTGRELVAGVRAPR